MLCVFGPKETLSISSYFTHSSNKHQLAVLLFKLEAAGRRGYVIVVACWKDYFMRWGKKNS